MQLVYGVNSNYLFPACVSIWSVWSNTSRPVDITIFEDGFSQSDYDVIKQMCASSKCLGSTSSINIVPFNSGQFKEYSIKTTTIFPAITLLPLVIPSLLEGRVVFLDADTLVVTDIWKILETDLKKKPIGACTDIGHMDWYFKLIKPKVFESIRLRKRNEMALKRMRAMERVLTLGYVPGENYFNAGVLLMDCDRIRRMPNFNELCSFEGLFPHLRFYPEQDRLNEFFSGNWSQIHCKWNTPAKVKRYIPSGENRLKNFTSDDVKKQIQEAYQQPMIWHYMGRKKPWNTKRKFNRSFKEWLEVCKDFENKTGLNFLLQ